MAVHFPVNVRHRCNYRSSRLTKSPWKDKKSMDSFTYKNTFVPESMSKNDLGEKVEYRLVQCRTTIVVLQPYLRLCKGFLGTLVKNHNNQRILPKSVLPSWFIFVIRFCPDWNDSSRFWRDFAILERISTKFSTKYFENDLFSNFNLWNFEVLPTKLTKSIGSILSFIIFNCFTVFLQK